MLKITVPATELFDGVGNFINTKEQTLQLEHSLVSLSKWEAKWHKPYLSRKAMTIEETIDYIRCMTLTQNVDPNVYIQSIQLTQGNHTPGSTDIYTVTMTDGSKYNIAVYNGLNGTGTGDVLGIHFDLVLPASGWSNGSITVAESRLVAAAKYKYLIDAYEASREEYLECSVRPKDISTTGFITFVNDTDPIKDITVNIVRLELSVNAEEGGE